MTSRARESIPRASAISFDYGHVLGGLDLDALAERLAELGLASDSATLRERMKPAYRAHDASIARGEGHEAAWRALMDVLVAMACEEKDARAEVVDRLWRAQPTRNLWRHVPDEARRLLEDLDRAGIPMVVTSNSEGRARELLEEVGIARFFRGILDSGVLGWSKPDRRIFEYAASLLGVPLASIVHVGDSESADVVGAKEAGALAVRFDAFVPGAAEAPSIAHARAESYDELRAILATWLDRPNLERSR